jgi:hypothetical protein
MNRLLHANESPNRWSKSTLLLRVMARGVFFWEGLLKFVYACALPWPPRRPSARNPLGTRDTSQHYCASLADQFRITNSGADAVSRKAVLTRNRSPAAPTA